MISDVDESLRTLIRRDALNGTDVEVVLDAPTKEWSTRRNAPTLDLYLYDIREDLRRRENGLIDRYDDAGRVMGRVKPPRYYKLSYLITAWTQRPEDEHRLLAAVLACFLRHDRLPDDVLVGQLATLTLPVAITIALPPPEDRALSDVWSALGGELKPSLDLVVTSPFDAGQFDVAAPLVLESLRLQVHAGEPGEAITNDSAHSDEDAGAEQAGVGTAGEGRSRLVEETVTGGAPQHPGRVFRLLNMTEDEAEPRPDARGVRAPEDGQGDARPENGEG
jgi:hypothetical protein